MATQVVELTGDEAKLLRSIQAIVNKEEQHRQKLLEVGRAGEQAGGKMEKSLQGVGQTGDRELKKVLGGIGAIGKDGETSFTKLGMAAAKQLGGIALGFVGVERAIQSVNRFLEDQEALYKRSLDRQVDLARAQQDAAKNLAGLSLVQRDELLQQAVPDIARSTGFSDTAAITTALGEVASAGESDSARIANAVRQAARIERLTPQNLGATASTSSALLNQTGLVDIRQAIGLLETSGTQARITDPKALAQTLPRAVGSIVSTVRSQNPEEAARQAAAFFSQVTQGGNDEKGTSSATFAIDFANRLNKFFTGIEDERINARSKVELIDRKIAKGSDTEANRRDREQLLSFLSASEGVEDPGEFFKRLESLQSSPDLAKQFKGEGFGEKQFQTTLDDLITKGSPISKNLLASFETIQASVEFFEREANAIAGGTPQLAIANFRERIKAGATAQEAANVEGSLLQAVREGLTETLKDTRSTGGRGYLQSVFEPYFVGRGGLQGQTAASESVSAVARLASRQFELAAGGVTDDERAKIDRISGDLGAFVDLIKQRPGEFGATVGDAQTISSLTESLIRSTPQLQDEESKTIAKDQVALLTEIYNAMLESARANKETAANTAPGTPNYGNIQRGAR